MVKDMWLNSTIGVIRSFFSKELPQFIEVKEISHGPFWEIEFRIEDIRVIIRGDVGFSIYIYIYGSEYELWQYDRSINEKMKTTEDNIIYQLNILKRALNELL